MRVASLEGHRIWSATYDDVPNPLLALEARVLSDSLAPLEGRRFLDVACGTGRWMVHAQSRGARATGVDLCQEMLLQAAPKPRLWGHLVRGAAELLPLAGGVADVVLCSFALGYFESAGAAIREMARVCARGARIVVSDVHSAALSAGWKRSFRSGGLAYEIDHASDASTVVLEAALATGLRLESTAAAYLGESEREIFSRAGKEHLFAEASRVPAIWIATWIKP